MSDKHHLENQPDPTQTFASQYSSTLAHSHFYESYKQSEVDTLVSSYQDQMVLSLEEEIENMKRKKDEEKSGRKEIMRKKRDDGEVWVQVEGYQITMCTIRKEKKEQQIESLRRENQELKERVQQLEGQLSNNTGQTSQEQELVSRVIALQTQIVQKDIQIQTLKSSLQSFSFQKRKNDEYLQNVKYQLSRYEATVAQLQNLIKKQIVQIPVYIQKDLIVQVPVPIYINQKQQKINQRYIPTMMGSSMDENSIAANEINQSMEIIDDNNGQEDEDEGGSGAKSRSGGDKLGLLCRSIVGSNVSEDIQQSNMNFETSQRNAEVRERRIKEIVQVPVYIFKQVIKQVEKPVVQEIIIEKEVIKYINLKQSCELPNYQLGLDSQRCSGSLNNNFDLLLLSNEKISRPVSQQEEIEHQQEEERPMESHIKREEQDDIRVSGNYEVEENLKIQQEPEKEQELKEISKMGAQSEKHRRKKSEQSVHSGKEIIIEVPVQIEKIITVQVPKEIIVEVEKIKEVIVERPVQVIIERPVEVIKEIIVEKIIEKEVYIDMPESEEKRRWQQYVKIVPLELPVQIEVQKIIEIEEVWPIQITIPVQTVIKQTVESIQNDEEPISKIQPQQSEVSVTQELKQELKETEKSRQHQVKQTDGFVIQVAQIPIEIIDRSEVLVQRAIQLLPQEPKQQKQPQKTSIQVQTESIPEKVIQKQVIVEVPKEVQIIRQIQVIKEVPIYITVKQVAEPPKEIIKEVEVIKQIEVLKEVVVEKERIVEIIKEIPVEIPIQKIVWKEVPIFVEKEKIVYRDVPVEVQKIVQVQKIIYVDRIVEKEVIKQVQVEKIIRVEIPVEIIKQVYIERPVSAGSVERAEQEQHSDIRQVHSEVNRQIEQEKVFENNLEKEVSDAYIKDNTEDIADSIVKQKAEVREHNLEKEIVGAHVKETTENIADSITRQQDRAHEENVQRDATDAYMKDNTEKIVLSVSMEELKCEKKDIKEFLEGLTEKIANKTVIIEVEKIVEKPVEIIIQKIIEKPVQIIVQKPVQVIVQKQVEVYIDKNVLSEQKQNQQQLYQKEDERVIQIKRPVLHQVEKIVEVPVYIERIKEVQKIVQIPVQKIVQVQKIIQVTRMGQIIELEKIVQIQKIVQVPIQIPVLIDRIIEIQNMAQIVQLQKIVEVPVQKIIYQDRIVEVEKIVQSQQKPVQIIVEKVIQIQKPIQVIREVEKIVYVDKPIQVQVEKIVYVDKIVQKLVQIQVEKIVYQERIVQVEKPVQIIVQRIQYIQKEVPVDVLKEVTVQVEKQVQVIKQIVVEKIVEVQVIREVPVEKIVYQNKIVEVQKIVEVPKEVVIQKIVTVEVPKEIIVEKEVIREVIVEKPVEIVKEVHFEKQVLIQTQIARQGQPQSPSSSPQQLHLNLDLITQLPQSRSGVLLSDREQQPQIPDQAFQLKDMPVNEGFQMKEHENGWQEEKEILIQRYHENQRRLEEEMKYLTDQFITISEENEEYKEENKELAEKLRNIKKEFEMYKKQVSTENQIQQERTRKGLQTQLKSKERQIQQFYSNIKELKISLKTQITNNASLNQKLVHLQNQRQTQHTQFLKQIQNLKDNYQDLITINQQYQEELLSAKERQEKLKNQYSLIDDELSRVKIELEDKHHEEYINKDQMELDYKQAVQKTEQIYRTKIEELIQHNYQVISAKNQQISQLDSYVKELQIQINKANDYISKLEKEQQLKQGTGGTKSDQRLTKVSNNNRSEIALTEENQRLSQMVDALKAELVNISQKGGRSQVESKKAGSQIQQQAAINIKGYNFTQREKESQNLAVPSSRQGNPSQKSRIKIQQISKSHLQDYQDDDIYVRMTKLVNEYSRQLQKKEQEIQKLKQLLCQYENVIQQMQRQKNGPYQNRGSQEGIYRLQGGNNENSRLKLETNVYVNNLLRKIALLEDQLKFERSQKLKITIRTRQLERAYEQVTVRQANQYYEDDSQLIQRLVYELQREKDKCEQFREENDAILGDMLKIKAELESLRSHPHYGQRNNQSITRGFSGILEPFDDQFESQLVNEENAVRYYKTFKVKYIKCLELTQLIKKQITTLQLRLPKNCTQIVDNIKRFIKIIENNEKNSTSNAQQAQQMNQNQRSGLSRAEKSGKIEYRGAARQSRENFQDEELIRDMRRIDDSVEEGERSQHSLWRQTRNRFADLSLDNWMSKSPPRQLRYFVSLKLIQFAISLLSSSSSTVELQNLCPQKLFLLNYNPHNPSSLSLTLSKKQKPKQKIRLYQSPQVLVGQPQTQMSYSWTIGIIIDRIFHGRLFYQKFGDILEHKDNYEFEDQDARDIGEIVEAMVVKNREHRLRLENAHEQVAGLLNQ